MYVYLCNPLGLVFLGDGNSSTRWLWIMPETCILSFRNSSLFIFILCSSIPVVADESKFADPIRDELCNWVLCNDCEKNRRLPVELEDKESDWYVLHSVRNGSALLTPHSKHLLFRRISSRFSIFTVYTRLYSILYQNVTEEGKYRLQFRDSSSTS